MAPAIPLYLPREGNVSELFVVKSLSFQQVLIIDRFPIAIEGNRNSAMSSDASVSLIAQTLAHFSLYYKSAKGSSPSSPYSLSIYLASRPIAPGVCPRPVRFQLRSGATLVPPGSWSAPRTRVYRHHAAPLNATAYHLLECLKLILFHCSTFDLCNAKNQD